MARLNQNEYTSIQTSKINNPVVFVVDMVNGFTKEGALSDIKIMDIVKAQKKLMDTLSCRNVFVCDTHPPKTREFEAYPAHCMVGTSEAEVVDELKDYIKMIIHKNSTNTFMAPEFSEFLKNDLDNYNDIIITGCCTDLCILQFALSLQGYLNEHNMCKHRIIIPVDCVETYHIDQVHDAYFWNDVSLKNMAANGITIVSKIEE